MYKFFYKNCLQIVYNGQPEHPVLCPDTSNLVINLGQAGFALEI